MNTDFGVVKKYFTDRGFGFVTRTFRFGRQKEVFFHIKNVKKTDPELAERLNRDDLLENIHFWYETEATNKGEQVIALIKPASVQERIADNLPNILGTITGMWKDLGSPVPSWLPDLTIDLAGIERASELRSKRADSEEEIRKAAEQKRKEREVAREIEAARQRLIDEEEEKEEKEKEKEFEKLVSEMAPLGFTVSAQVSAYIVRNKLGYKYQNISGILEMELDGSTWNFNGGFPTNIYARLCDALGLDNQGSKARPLNFESFKDLEDKKRKVLG